MRENHENGAARERVCVKCGQCMSVCPVFRVTNREQDVARGKLALLEAAEKNPAATWRGAVEEALSRCLQCGACSFHCANQVPAARLVRQGREEVFRHTGLGPLKELQLAVLAGDSLPSALLRKGGALLAALAGGGLEPESGLRVRFPLSFFTSRSVIPVFHSPSLLARASRPDNSASAVFFSGCGANHLFPDTPEALFSLARASGARLALPPGQGCCGLPRAACGDIRTARETAVKNMAALASPDRVPVVTACASCAGHLKEYPDLFPPGSPEHKQALVLAARVTDPAEWLMGLSGFGNVLEAVRARGNEGKTLRVFYHAPCHSRFGPAKTTAPARLLALAAPGTGRAGGPETEGCCGHGGTFNVRWHGLSMEILDGKMEKAARARPEWIVTDCTGCRLQLMEGAARAGLAARVAHPLALVAELAGKG
jgi:glycolate oxidase iron-sulfur subunit